MIDTYHLPRKNATFDIIIWHGHPWGGRFQMSVIKERQVTGGNGRGPSGQEGWLWEDFGFVISFGSGQLAPPMTF